MEAVVLRDGAYRLESCGRPVPEAGQVLIKVAYAGINRIDLLQLQGKYPLPSGTPCIPGLEVSGEIAECGSDVAGWKPGDKVCALLSENGFAQYVACHASLVLPVPDALSLQQAAALPEACATAWVSLVWQARLAQGETVLIHGGAGGIGVIAIQVARALGARVFTTAGSAEKCAVCRQAGAELAVNYREEDFVEVIKARTHGRGVDVILDMVGGDYLPRNLAALARGGRLCIIAFLRGGQVTLTMAPVLLKHLHIMGSTLRSRPLEEKARVLAELHERLWPEIAKSALKPVIDRVFVLKDAQKAFSRMDEGLNCGKILLKV